MHLKFLMMEHITNIITLMHDIINLGILSISMNHIHTDQSTTKFVISEPKKETLVPLRLSLMSLKDWGTTLSSLGVAFGVDIGLRQSTVLQKSS